MLQRSENGFGGRMCKGGETYRDTAMPTCTISDVEREVYEILDQFSSSGSVNDTKGIIFIEYLHGFCPSVRRALYFRPIQRSNLVMYLSRRPCVRSSQLSFKAAFKSPGNRWLLLVSFSLLMSACQETRTLSG